MSKHPSARNKPGKGTKERSQGLTKPSGVNKPVEKPMQKTSMPGVTYTKPTQRQKI